MVQFPGRKKACLIEEIFVVPKSSPQPVESMELLRGKDVLLISTGEKFLKIPVYRCARYNTRRKCLNARDPYCGWSLASRKCMRTPETISQNWEQELNSCPVLNTPVDGDWSLWSRWSTCSHNGQNGDQCKCRYRTCDNPEPQFGGQDCAGSSVEVSNCKVNGRWTPWSDWSACSQTCGPNTQRSRKRTCTNPSPAFGGRECDGPKMDIERCPNIQCPLPASQRAKWAQWGVWSECTHKCAGGMKVRTRRCERPPVRGPRNAENDCVGNDQEWVGCNTKSCEEARESSGWSAWMKTNYTREGHVETKFQSVCVASVEGVNHMKSRLKTKVRFCPANSNHCTGDQDIDDLEKGKYELTNQIPKDPASVDRFIEKYCKKVGYMNVKEISNRINQFSGGNKDVFTQKLVKYGRRYGLARRGAKRITDFSNRRNSKNGKKPEVHKIDPKDGGAHASQQRGLTHSSVFQGFCGCRDMGNLRMCYRCKQSPTKRSIKALKSAKKNQKQNLKANKNSNVKTKKQSHINQKSSGKIKPASLRSPEPAKNEKLFKNKSKDSKKEHLRKKRKQHHVLRQQEQHRKSQLRSAVAKAKNKPPNVNRQTVQKQG